VGQRLKPYALLAPVFLLLLVSFIAPLAQAAWRSFDGQALQFSRYAAIFSDPVYLAVFWRTLEVAVIVTALSVILGYPIAYLLTALARRSATVLAICLLIPLFTAFLIRTYGWMVILGRQGVLNKTLIGLGLIDAPLKILGTSTAVYVGMVHVLMPIAIFTMYASMARLDRSLVTAAQVLGANPVTAFVRVYVPMSLPGIISASVLVFIMALGFFITPALLGSPADTMIAQLIVTQINTLLDLQSGFALSVVLLLAIVVVLLASSRLVPLEQMWALNESTGRQSVGTIRHAALRNRVRALLYWMEAAVHAVLGKPAGLVGVLLRAYAVVVVLFLLAPQLIVYVLSFSSSPYLVFPPPGFSLQWYSRFFTSPEWRSALLISLQLAAIVASVSLAVGGAAAFGLVRGEMRAKRGLFLFVLSPLLVPVIVVALSLYVSMDDLGLLGTFPGLVLGHMVVAVPYAIVILVGAVRGLDRNLEHAASTLGARPGRVLGRITLPLLAPALVSAWIMAFLYSFDELLVTLFLLGRQPQTLPIKMWSDIRIQIDPVISAASSTIVTAIAIIVILSQARSLFGTRRRPELA
jgi:ABC-type spermidine/putrescine transport system permease subunit I